MHFNLVKATNRRYLEELNNKVHEMPIVYSSVNIIQFYEEGNSVVELMGGSHDNIHPFESPEKEISIQ